MIVLARIRNRQAQERKQLELLKSQDEWKRTVESKLRGLWETNQFGNFVRCGAEKVFVTCRGCKDVETFDYQCNLKWCPRCQWRISERRKAVVGLWAGRITQPKHLVLTQRNFPILTRGKIRDHTRCLAKMRRAKCFKGVRGGCVTVEITNEGNGWHLHSHWLVDCDWFDMEEVSKAWGKLVGQEYAIVKVKDVRNKEYLNEVSKYVVTGSELAKWPAEHLLEFVSAVKGRRFFFPFGSLFHRGPEIRKELMETKGPPRVCDCGCDEFVYESELTAVLNEIKFANRGR